MHCCPSINKISFHSLVKGQKLFVYYKWFHEYKIIPNIRWIFDNLESGKRKYCSRKKSGGSLVFGIQKSELSLQLVGGKLHS